VLLLIFNILKFEEIRNLIIIRVLCVFTELATPHRKLRRKDRKGNLILLFTSNSSRTFRNLD